MSEDQLRVFHTFVSPVYGMMVSHLLRDYRSLSFRNGLAYVNAIEE